MHFRPIRNCKSLMSLILLPGAHRELHLLVDSNDVDRQDDPWDAGRTMTARAYADQPTPCLPVLRKLTREAERLPGPFVCVYSTF